MPKTSTKFKTNTNLVIPQDILRYQARKIQILIRRLDQIAETAAGNVNVNGYITLLKEFESLVNRINANAANRLVEKSSREKTDLGAGTPDSLDIGVSADNPFAG